MFSFAFFFCVRVCLCVCEKKGHDTCVTYLLDAGADIKARDEHDYTALHLAAYYGRVGVVALLLR